MKSFIQASQLKFLKLNLYILFLTSIYSQNVSISGIVKNPADKPIKNATITIRNLKDEILYEKNSNRKGLFKFEDVEPKFYYVVVKHEIEGEKRVKLNPRKNKNNDISLLFLLNGKNQPIECYLYNSAPPTNIDPILNIKNFTAKASPEFIGLSWKGTRQAKLYTLYENGTEIYVGENTRFEKNVEPGKEFCFTIKASGNFNLEGELSNPVCLSAPTFAPRDIKIKVFKKEMTLNWSKLNGAFSYDLYQDDKKVGNYLDTTVTLKNLKYSKEYFFKIIAIDALGNESKASIEVKSKTHDYVAAPILSSMSKTKKVTLIWNEVQEAKTYNIYREGVLISSSDKTSFTDSVLPGKQYCYRVSCVDQYNIESNKSNQHCSKIPLDPPTGITADADVSSMHLNWNDVVGSDSYNIYEKIDQDSINYLGKTKSTQFTVKPLDFSQDVCFVITSIDMDGIESQYSSTACNIVFDPPHFIIQKMNLNEPSGNEKIDANELGVMQFSIFNDGQSPAHNLIFSVVPVESDPYVRLGEPFVLETLEAGRIKFAEIAIQSELQVGSGNNSFELKVSSKEKINLDEPFLFNVETESMVPPQLIIADFAISNEFGTHYIPKNEIVNLTVRVQNVGEGSTDYGILDVKENRTFSTPDYTGKTSLPMFKSGDYIDIQIPILTNQENFTVDILLTDYLNKTTQQRLDLECMRNYRSPIELIIQDLGVEDIIYYPDELGEVDVDRKIPFGRKNPKGLAIILGVEEYDDDYYPILEYSNRDKSVIRSYFSEAFGLSDFQMLPSKSWQMDGGPSLEDFNSTFDPHQGDLRKRILTAEKYSDIDQMDIFVYFRGYGQWVNGKPLLIPKDAQAERQITKYPLEGMIKNLIRLSVLENINTITIFLDITYINPEESVGLLWDFPEIPDKICILSASSNGESSQLYHDKKHSFYTYSILKGLSGAADDGDSIIELGELTEYVYKKIPEYVRLVPGAIKQNPKFNGMDLKRTLLDLR